MKGKVIIVPECTAIEGPLVFTAGPIQGAVDWQSEAIDYFQKVAPYLNIASPRRGDRKEGNFSKELYNQQVDWETFHLRRAAEDGAIMFWLAKENEHLCRRAYAQTSRFEIAECKIRHERDGINLVVGIEEGFSGAKYIRRRFGQDCPDVPILSTLEDTCQATIDIIRGYKI